MLARHLPLSPPQITLALAGLAALLAFPACGHPVQRKLEGRWLGDGVEAFDDEQVAPATGWVKGTAFEFSGSNVTVSIPAEEPRRGSYKVARVHQADVTLDVARKDGSLDRVQFKLDDERSLRWMIGGGRAVVFRKQD